MGYSVMVRLLLAGLFLSVPMAASAKDDVGGPIVDKGKFIEKKLNVGESKVISLDKPAEVKQLVTDSTEVAAAGFISTLEETDVSIYGDPNGLRDLFSSSDNVYIVSSKDIAPGTMFLAFHPRVEVQDPLTGRNMGKVMKVTGIVKVISKADGKYVGVVQTAFGGITNSDLLAEYKEPAMVYLPVPTKPALKGRVAYVLATKEERELTMMNDIVYLNLGVNDGVQVGDAFVIRRSGDFHKGFVAPEDYVSPDIFVAEIRVISADSNTSTAKVVNSVEPVIAGYRAVYKD